MTDAPRANRGAPAHRALPRPLTDRFRILASLRHPVHCNLRVRRSTLVLAVLLIGLGALYYVQPPQPAGASASLANRSIPVTTAPPATKAPKSSTTSTTSSSSTTSSTTTPRSTPTTSTPSYRQTTTTSGSYYQPSSSSTTTTSTTTSGSGSRSTSSSSTSTTTYP